MAASGLHSSRDDAELSHLTPTSESVQEKYRSHPRPQTHLALPNYKNKIIKFFSGWLYDLVMRLRVSLAAVDRVRSPDWQMLLGWEKGELERFHSIALHS